MVARSRRTQLHAHGAPPAFAAQLATLVRAPPDGDEWLHEQEFDGCRVGARVHAGTVELRSREGQDCTAAFASVAAAVGRLGAKSALLDGEVAVVLPSGLTSSPSLQQRGSATHLTYFVFDLLHLDGEDLSGLPLEARKRRLQKLVGANKSAGGVIKYSAHVAGGGADFHREACRLGLGGMVSKRRDRPHRPGRSPDWQKTACGPARRRGAPDVVVGGVRISHPERLLFPELGVTKADIARYYERVAERMLPHVVERPLTLLRCDRAIEPKLEKGGCVMIKHAKAWGPLPLRRVEIQELRKTGEYLVAVDPAGLISLAQMGVVEVHTWNGRAAAPYQHDRIVLDLDPGVEVAWRRVVAGAHALRAAVKARGLRSWVKTTGGKGLHVVVPVAPAPWEACLAFARAVAAELIAAEPRAYTLAVPKAGREDKILIDALRNARANTAVAAFSVRARANAPVSLPVAWEDVTPKLDPLAFTMKTVLERSSDDPWSDYWTARQRLPRAAR